MTEVALDEKPNFDKGKGKTLSAMLGLLVVALSAFAWYVVSGQPNPYGELGKQVNGLRGRHFDQFMACALPGARIAAIKDDRALREEFINRARGGGARYATHLRQKCGAELDELAPQLRALLPPEDAAGKVEAMAQASADLRRATNAFAEHAAASEGAYQSAAAEAAVEPVARAWYEFRKAHAELNSLVRRALGRG